MYFFSCSHALRLVTDYNWITNHFLQCIHIHLLRAKEEKKNKPMLENVQLTPQSDDVRYVMK